MIDKYKIYEFLRGQKSVAEILDEVKCSKATFYRIKSLMGSQVKIGNVQFAPQSWSDRSRVKFDAILCVPSD